MTDLHIVSHPHIEFNIGRAAEPDVIGLAELRAQFFSDQIAKGLTENSFPNLGRLPSDTLKLIHRRRTAVFVAFRNRSVVGYVFGQTKFVPNNPNSVVCTIEELFVAKNQRRFDLARNLVIKVMSEFRQMGAQKIELRVLTENEEGEAFWRHLGFGASYSVFEYRGSEF